MLNAKSFLAVDFGAVNLKLAEFELTEDGGLLLKQYGFKSLGQDGLQETTRAAAMRKGLQDLLAERAYSSKNINVCAPGFHTFSKFVKLPPVDTSKVTQIIQYEAQQNVPFPLEEVVWDYQILGSAPSGELEVLLVAIKSDVVEGLFQTAEAAGLRLQLVDVSPAALCNAFRYNYGDLEGCTMLLDIGAKTSNLLFFEKGNVYSRGINIGANAITQDFAKEGKLSFEEAEKMKIEDGFVSLGGAYEEPENPQQAAISKIARQVLTRLHIQVNQTVQFYRGQQGGSAPQRLFLSGGASIMPYTAQFFSEKLNVPVEYFNPFRNVQIDPELNREELAKVAHSMGEVVGLGLRNLAHCPVEMNLMPKSSLKRQAFDRRKPYYVASVFCVVLIVFAFGWFYQQVATEKAITLKKLTEAVTPLAQRERPMQAAMAEVRIAQGQAEQYGRWLNDRSYWVGVLGQLRDALRDVEKKMEEGSKQKMGVWVERFTPLLPAGATGGGPPPGPPPPGGRGRRGGGGPPPPGAQPSGPNEISTVIVQCRGLNMNTTTAAAANTTIADALAQELKGRTNTFDPEGTNLSGNLAVDQNELTFSFEITVKLKSPLRL